MNATPITVGTQRTRTADGYRHTGVLRHGNTILATCGHEHTNRDQSTRTSGESARDCITMALRSTVNAATRDDRADSYRNAWMRLTRGSFTVPASTIDKAKADSAANADQFLALVDRIAHLLAEHGQRVDTSWGGTRIAPISCAV